MSTWASQLSTSRPTWHLQRHQNEDAHKTRQTLGGCFFDTRCEFLRKHSQVGAARKRRIWYTYIGCLFHMHVHALVAVSSTCSYPHAGLERRWENVGTCQLGCLKRHLFKRPFLPPRLKKRVNDHFPRVANVTPHSGYSRTPSTGSPTSCKP